jgi:hypothetical protein
VSAGIDWWAHAVLQAGIITLHHYTTVALFAYRVLPAVDFTERCIVVNYDVSSVLADAAGGIVGTEVEPHKKRLVTPPCHGRHALPMDSNRVRGPCSATCR